MLPHVRGDMPVATKNSEGDIELTYRGKERTVWNVTLKRSHLAQ